MYRLCWIPTGWDTPEMFRGVPHSAEFESLEQLKRIVSKCVYGGEWVEDSKGNKIDINLKEVCLEY